jgi:ABC-2 type transport system ATP-binding protein
MTQLAIEMREVYKSFRKTAVLTGTTLTVEQGQTFAFLGRNGSGKTTSIRLMLGLLGRDSGRLRVLGHDPAVSAIDVRQQVGYLAEDQAMYGWMKVQELVRFVAPFYATWDHDLAMKYLREFELPLDRKVKQLSKGQNVRLGLVLALAHRPELVILDDPALGLDPVMRRQFNRDLISHLQSEGRTVFYSSHLLYEVEPIADEVAILSQGRIVRQAKTERLRRDVRQLVLRRDLYDAVRDDLAVLECDIVGDEVAATVENAEAVVALLDRQAIAYRLVDLNLDEIFTAYVSRESTPPPQSDSEEPEPAPMEA